MTGIVDLLTNLAACLCEQIEEANLPMTCFCGVLPGEQAYDVAGLGDCEDDVCGQAWVRLATSYPSNAVGVIDQTIGNCGTGMGYDIEIGIQRCLQTNSGGEALTQEELLEATTLQLADMDVLYRTVACCDTLDSKDYIIIGYTPTGPEGGLLGGVLTVSVGE